LQAKLGSGRGTIYRSESKSPAVLDLVNRLNLRSTILDGEIVALDSEGLLKDQE
jgi:hypothetical protein